MILNDRQRTITLKQASKLQEAIVAFDLDKALALGVSPLIAQAQHDALVAEFNELKAQVASYDRLKARPPLLFEAENLVALPQILIKARIAKQMTQRELAERLGLKEQQIQRYEADHYGGANLTRLAEVADALGIHLNIRAKTARERKSRTRFAAAKGALGAKAVQKKKKPNNQKKRSTLGAKNLFKKGQSPHLPAKKQA